MDIKHDDEFIGKFVQDVGHIQILEAGNAMLSMHIVEPAFNSLGGLDPTTVSYTHLTLPTTPYV